MNIDEIMGELEQHREWRQDAPELAPCVFCGGAPRLIVRHPPYGKTGAWVQCRTCHACGPSASINALIITPRKLSTPMTPESLERGITAAVEAWNSRAVDLSRLTSLRMNEVPA